jgi:glutamate-1-semialdehyde 2,1-aminomutase
MHPFGTNLYYHYMLDHGIYLASRGYTTLNLEITDDNVDEFVGVVEEFLALHISDLKIER